MAIVDGRFFTWDELRGLMSDKQAIRVFDDEGDGVATEAAVNTIISNTDQHVISHAVKNYPDEVADTVTPVTAHPFLKTLALEFACALAAKRMPGAMSIGDPDEAMRVAKSNLRDLATGKIHLRASEQSNAQSHVSSGVVLGGSTDREFNDFGAF